MSTHSMHYNLCSLLTDDTDNINQVISSNSPKSCLSYLTDLEKKGDPYTDCNHLTRLVDSYIRVFFNMPLGKHCENESYARMLVRFAELKVWVAIAVAWIWIYSSFCCCCPQRVLDYLDFYSYWIRIQDVNEAEDNFKVASSHCQNFAFVHIAHAQFERSQGRDEHIFKLFYLMSKYRHDTACVDLIVCCYIMYPGNTKRAIYILQNALELGAKPKEVLETALQSMQGGKTHLFCSEDKENIQCKYSLLKCIMILLKGW